jgi:transposase
MPDMLNRPNLKLLSLQEEPEQYSILAEMDTKPTGREKCHNPKLYSHGARRQVYIDIPPHGKMVAITLDRKRWRCQECGTITQQPLPDMADDHQMTQQLVDQLEKTALRRTFADVVRKTGLDEKTVRRISLWTSSPTDLPRSVRVSENWVIELHFTGHHIARGRFFFDSSPFLPCPGGRSGPCRGHSF